MDMVGYLLLFFSVIGAGGSMMMTVSSSAGDLLSAVIVAVLSLWAAVTGVAAIGAEHRKESTERQKNLAAKIDALLELQAKAHGIRIETE